MVSGGGLSEKAHRETRWGMEMILGAVVTRGIPGPELTEVCSTNRCILCSVNYTTVEIIFKRIQTPCWGASSGQTGTI